MECALNKSSDGFTLVEISIVMIIIGLLIGGTFGGMRLIENMQINRTVQDFKSIDSAALTFKDTYGRLPGDITNPATRLPNCTAAPCATGGDGNRILGTSNVIASTEALTATSEKFTFWHHLRAADLAALGTHNTIDLNFAEGQPKSGLDGGYRIYGHFSGQVLTPLATWTGHVIYLTGVPDIAVNIADPVIAAAHRSTTCGQLRSVDMKMDDGLPRSGRTIAHSSCLLVSGDETSSYANPDAMTSIAQLMRF